MLYTILYCTIWHVLYASRCLFGAVGGDARRAHPAGHQSAAPRGHRAHGAGPAAAHQLPAAVPEAPVMDIVENLLKSDEII